MCVHRKMILSISAISFVPIPCIVTSFQFIAFILYSETIFLNFFIYC